jgi:hypothetical protein
MSCVAQQGLRLEILAKYSIEPSATAWLRKCARDPIRERDPFARIDRTALLATRNAARCTKEARPPGRRTPEPGHSKTELQLLL